MRQTIIALCLGLLLFALQEPHSASAVPTTEPDKSMSFAGTPVTNPMPVNNVAPTNWVSQRTGNNLLSDDHLDFNLLGHDVLQAAAVWDRYVPDARQQGSRFWGSALHRTYPTTSKGSALCWEAFSPSLTQINVGALGAFDDEGIKMQLYGAEIVVNLPDNRPGQYSWASVDNAKEAQERLSVALLMDPQTGVKSFTEYRDPGYARSVAKLWELQIQGRILDFVNEFGRFPSSLDEVGLVQGVALSPSDMPIPANWNDVLQDTQRALYILMSPQTGTLELVTFVPGGSDPRFRLLPHRIQYEYDSTGRVRPARNSIGKLQPPSLDPSFCVRAWRVPTAP